MGINGKSVPLAYLEARWAVIRVPLPHHIIYVSLSRRLRRRGRGLTEGAMQLRYVRRGARCVAVVRRAIFSSSAANMSSILDITGHAGSRTAIREVGGREVSYADLLRER